ncbi:hypothetical protein GBA52_028576 [Prunus armeniaca]|nr:hypothetical protein GBA52_028576 [Prunus armeniaca]
MQTLEGLRELPREWCLKGQEPNIAEIPNSPEIAIYLQKLYELGFVSLTAEERGVQGLGVKQSKRREGNSLRLFL